MKSISLHEAQQQFHFTPDLLDSLVRGGHLLCHMRGNEARIPLEQLETFFREGLLRVYRAEATAASLPVVEPPPDETKDETEIALDEAPLAPEPVEAAVPEPAPVAEPSAAPIELPDFRQTPRFIPRRPISGIYDDVKFSVVQLSSGGLRIRHDEEIVPGSEAKVSFALLNPPRSVVLRARVVWTSVANYESGSEGTFYISGLRVIDHAERLARAIEVLSAAHELQPDRRTFPRTRKALDLVGGAPSSVSDDEMALVLKALQTFAGNPMEATRCYSRGKFALADAAVRRDAPQKPREREEVLAVWEYTDHQVAIPKIVDVLSWIRRSRVRAVAQ